MDYNLRSMYSWTNNATCTNQTEEKGLKAIKIEYLHHLFTTNLKLGRVECMLFIYLQYYYLYI